MIYLYSIGFVWIDSGFNGKTWWDIFELLIIPLTLTGIAIVMEYYERKTDREIARTNNKLNQDIAKENHKEKIIQDFFDSITNLIFDRKLLNSMFEDEVRKIAYIKTITTLKRLDPGRKTIIIEFLSDTKLIQQNGKRKPIISLERADLENINLQEADLQGVDFRRANLKGADLSGANLNKANFEYAFLNHVSFWSSKLQKANFYRAKLISTHFPFADLVGANFSEALIIVPNWLKVRHSKNVEKTIIANNLRSLKIDREGLKDAKFENATMPDGKIFDPEIHTFEYLTGIKMGQLDEDLC